MPRHGARSTRAPVCRSRAPARTPWLRISRRRWSYHWVPVRRRVPAGHEVLELTLDVGEKRGGAEPEQIGPLPALAQLFLHQDQPVERLLGLANPARRLEANCMSGTLVVVADLSRHDHADGEGRVHGFLACRRL